jgi:tripartite-type tricarboxylate transporter receptor subunit TctC
MTAKRLLLLIGVLPATLAQAQAPSGPVAARTFPSKTVTIVSPYQAGGTSDIIARILARKLSERWGRTVIVENRPGANGSVGVNQVVHAAPDGHALLAAASSALTLNPIFYRNLSYNVERDLAPITRTGVVANVMVVNPAVPADDVQALVTLAKSKPGELIYASQGIGSNGHVTAEQFRLRAGIDYRHVPYRGSAPAMEDLLAGQVQIMFDNLPSALPQITSGNLRALAVTTPTRSPLLPEVPTIAESGYPGFESSAWFAVLTSKATPQDVRDTLEQAIIAVLTQPRTGEELRAAGVEVAADGAAELAQRIETETRLWRDVVLRANIRIE